jgi:hypothetical protein
MLILALLGSACTPTKAIVQSATFTGPSGDSTDGDGDESRSDDDPEDREPTEEEEEEEEEEPADRARWTVLVYLNGDNNLEENALIDLNEMEGAGSTDDVQLLVQLDRSSSYSRDDGNWAGARRYRVEKDDDPHSINSPTLEDLGNVDSGLAETYVDFVRWGVENFPADRYALVIWDHGWGWDLVPGPARKGVSEDEQTGNWLSVAGGDMEQLLADATDITGGKLSLLGMDACLMANWEIATVAAPYAEIYVASQATESVDGWAYHTAYADLIADPEMDGEELGNVFAQRFIETYDATQSVVDLRDLEPLNNAIDLLALEVMDAENPRDAIIDAARSAQTFDGDVPDRDLGDLSLLLMEDSGSADIADAAAVAWEELQGTVVGNYTYGGWVRRATGLSIYLPTRHDPDPQYAHASWGDQTHWDEMLEAISH